MWRYTGLLERMIKHVDYFLSPSRFTLRKHIEMGLEVPMMHMPYFLPLPQEQEFEYSTDPAPERPYFLFVGRLERIKGLQNIIPVFKEQNKYDLFVAGDGAYSGELKDLAGGSPNIKFLGRLDQKQLHGLYKNAVAVIVPSICYETFGIIVIEAFSRKTPVIVNNLGALPEVVEDSGGGFVYETREQLTSAMNKLASDPALRKDLGEKGFVAYRTYWDEEAHLKRYMGMVSELVAERTARLRAPAVSPLAAQHN